MNFFSWFKKEKEVEKHVNLVESFSTEDEPKVVDFPKEKYSVYWEIYLGEYAQDFIARVRFYKFAGGGFVSEEVSIKPTIKELKKEVNKIILDKMETFRK